MAKQPSNKEIETQTRMTELSIKNMDLRLKELEVTAREIQLDPSKRVPYTQEDMIRGNIIALQSLSQLLERKEHELHLVKRQMDIQYQILSKMGIMPEFEKQMEAYHIELENKTKAQEALQQEEYRKKQAAKEPAKPNILV